MSITQFTVSESHGIPRDNELVTVSIPLPQGLLNTDSGLVLLDEHEKAYDFSGIVLNCWPDSSIKWLKIVFVTSLAAHEQRILRVAITEITTQIKRHEAPPFVTGTDFGLLGFDPTQQLTALQGECKARVNGKDYSAIVATCTQATHSDFGNLNIANYSLTGYFQDTQKNKLGMVFNAEVSVNWSQQNITTSITVHNPEAALHPGGMWDLGDKNSIFLETLLLSIHSEAFGHVHISDTESSKEYSQTSINSIEINQLNSGGENFDCINHVDKDNRVNVGKKGYSFKINDSVMAGDRITPTVMFEGETKQAITLRQFWQNFPKAIIISSNVCTFYLFPTPVELQAGEKKTHTFVQSYGEQASHLENIHKPIITSLSPEWIEQCDVIPFFATNTSQSPLLKLLKEEALQKSNNFFAKREKIDEFGWRNFGELYADHESSRHTEDTPFISHYNNQYDPIYGFINQYLLSSDPKWLELSNDLANHVVDIDIYHTDKDKAEYNHGLFWHTDHYNQAHTSTHRTFSKQQQKAAYGNQSDGGGPGGQHCYTTGLTLHYCISGNVAAKQAVLNLTDWIRNIYEGSGSIFEFGLRLRKNERDGHKNMMTNTYPFDRGAGHYIIALLDSFYLSNEIAYLEQAREVIQHTISINDKIEERKLDDPERTWFYVVFLQAVARFLRQNKQLRAPLKCSHVELAFEKYIIWMLHNEKPFLDSADKLEFINATWVAQDLRKAWLFDACLSINCLPDQKVLLTERSQFFKDYVFEKLKNSPEKHYSRIIALVMQNLSSAKSNKTTSYGIRTQVNVQNPFKRKTLKDNVWQLVKNASLNKEIAWLKSRLR